MYNAKSKLKINSIDRKDKLRILECRKYNILIRHAALLVIYTTIPAYKKCLFVLRKIKIVCLLIFIPLIYDKTVLITLIDSFRFNSM